MIGQRPTLRFGDRGPVVVGLQRRLIALGYYAVLNGEFLHRTLEAVRSFQADQGLVVDGIVGDETWACLDRVGGDDD